MIKKARTETRANGNRQYEPSHYILKHLISLLNTAKTFILLKAEGKPPASNQKTYQSFRNPLPGTGCCYRTQLESSGGNLPCEHRGSSGPS